MAETTTADNRGNRVPTLDDVKSRTPDELRALIEQCETALLNMHQDERGALRELTDDEQKAFDAILEVRDAGAKRLKDHDRIARTFADFGQTRSAERAYDGERRSPEFMRQVQSFTGDEVRSLNRGEVRDRSLKVLESREHTSHLSDEVRARFDTLLRTHSDNMDGVVLGRLLLATESEEYRNAYRTYLAYGGVGYLTREEGLAVRQVNELRTAMSLSDSAGGYAVPVLIDPTIILTAQGHPNDFFMISRVESITNDEWKGVSSAGATWYWTTEGVAATDGAPTLAQPTVPTKRLTGWIPYSVEIGGDYPNFASEMSRILLEGYSEKVVEGLTNGLGTTAQPTGVVTKLEATTASQVAVNSDGAFVAEDIYDLWAALPIRFRANARWMSSTAVSNAIRQFAAGSSNSDANFSINITQEEIPRLLGRPYHLNDYMDSPATGTTSDCSLIIVGDWRHFLIAQRIGMTTEVVQHVMDTTTGTPKGQRGLWAWARIGSDVTATNAFRVLSQD